MHWDNSATSSAYNLYSLAYQGKKGDLMAMFHELHSGDLPIFSLNFGVISLIPKAQEVNRIQ
jgi:hypothetical protein